MYQKKTCKKKIIPIFIVAHTLSMMSSLAFASAFQSFEQNTSGLGEADAGAAAIGNDASTEFDNPAAMTRLKKSELDVSAVSVSARSRFTATKSTDPLQENVSGKTVQSPLGEAILPGIHAVVPLKNRMYFGFGITVPYGFQTRYDDDGVVRYIATKSRLETMNINPSVAYKINDHWSVGLGVSAQRLKAELDQEIQTSFIIGNEYYPDMKVKNDADNWGYGANVGVLYEKDENTRFGLSYRSQVFHHLKGNAKFYYPSALDMNDITWLKTQGYNDSKISSKITLPAIAILSGYHRVNPHWAVMGSVTYTGWHVFKKLALNFKSETNEIIHGNNPKSLPPATTIENFRDTFKYAVGVNYIQSPKTTWRAGAAYDMTPVRKKYRTVRLPDTNRIWLTVGVHQQFNQHLSFDLAYARIFFKGSSVDQQVAVGPDLYYEVAGNYRHSFANVFGAQVNWQFG